MTSVHIYSSLKEVIKQKFIHTEKTMCWKWLTTNISDASSECAAVSWTFSWRESEEEMVAFPQVLGGGQNVWVGTQAIFAWGCLWQEQDKR